MRYGTAVKSGSRRSLPKAPINKSTQNQWRKNHEHTAAVATRSPRREKGEIMAQQKFLVTGATGHTGGYTVEQLLERGHGVRALAHREDDRSKRLEKMGAEVVIGDFLKFNDVRAAMRGVRGAYFCYPIRPGILQATAYFAQAAKEAGLECVVNMSQKSAREDALSHAAQDHWLSEQVFDWSGITATHLRPTYFDEWLLYLAPMIRAGVLHVPFGTGRHAPIAAEDQARVIVGILENPNPHRRQVYPLYGPVEFTHAEIAQVLSRVLGWEVQYKQVSMETMRTMMASGGQKPPPGHNARALYGEFEPKPERQGDSFAIQHLREVAIDHQNGIFAGTNDLVEKIAGRPPTTLGNSLTSTALPLLREYDCHERVTVDSDAERDGVRRTRRESMSRVKTLVTGATGMTGSH